MKMFLLCVFVGINLLIRLPIRIAIRFFKVNNDKLDTADLLSTLASAFCFVGLCIYALIAEEVNTGLAIACIVLFGGIFLLISGTWLYVEIKERIEKRRR